MAADCTIASGNSEMNACTDHASSLYPFLFCLQFISIG